MEGVAVGLTLFLLRLTLVNHLKLLLLLMMLLMWGICMQAVVGSFEDVVVDDVSDRLVGDAEGDLQAVVVEVVVAPKVPSGVEFPSLQDSVKHKRERGRPAKSKKTNIDDRKVLMEKIQGKKVSCLLRQILGH
ncbi:hypothetical protein V6N12_066124 [Hibiscus sabdariffa]|uniref:Uncharacterized protein n=1 Tax=Hibiscus sabdariffa TaxID=183260 RepID=A0ABR2B919_9ROSI